MDDAHMLVLILALMIGVMLRTYLTFQQKVQNARHRQVRDPSESIPEFDHTYTGTAVASFITALITALWMFPQASEMINPDISYLGLFVFGIVYALGWNELWNRYIAPFFIK